MISVKKSYLALFWRLFCLLLALGLQAVVLVVSLIRLDQSFPYFYFLTTAAGVLLAHGVVAADVDPAYKIAWLIPLLAFPLFGLVLYVFFGRNSFGSRRLLRFRAVESERRRFSAFSRAEFDNPERVLQGQREVTKEIENEKAKEGREKEGRGELLTDFGGTRENRDARGLSDEMQSLLRAPGRPEDEDALLQARYIARTAGCPLSLRTKTSYFSTGESLFAAMLEAVEKAERFVFLEFFIISAGVMWDRLLALLSRKRGEGVDVRVLYDGVGSLTKLSPGYDRRLRAMGIQCRVFNPAVPVFSVALNKRDHRKILVVDGVVAFTGGANIADEYINAGNPDCHWKDAGLRLEGEAVRSFSAMFLSMWNFFGEEEREPERFLSPSLPPAAEETDMFRGWVQPYCDTPVEREGVGATVYRNLIGRARRSVYIMTPYLILDSTTENLLLAAAGCGVDVRIITPGVGDKAFVHAMTRSCYFKLLSGGVRIFEYTPGFIHSKVILADGRMAAVGSVNLDFRSLYLQFECAVWLYGAACLSDIAEDFRTTFRVCREITPNDCRSLCRFSLFRFFLRPYIPLL